MSETIELKHPITLNGEDLQHLCLRRPKVRDMLAADKASGSDAEKEVRVFANLCEVAPTVIEELDIADYQALQERYAGFLS